MTGPTKNPIERWELKGNYELTDIAEMQLLRRRIGDELKERGYESAEVGFLQWDYLAYVYEKGIKGKEDYSFVVLGEGFVHPSPILQFSNVLHVRISLPAPTEDEGKKYCTELADKMDSIENKLKDERA